MSSARVLSGSASSLTVQALIRRSLSAFLRKYSTLLGALFASSSLSRKSFLRVRVALERNSNSSATPNAGVDRRSADIGVILSRSWSVIARGRWIC